MPLTIRLILASLALLAPMCLGQITTSRHVSLKSEPARLTTSPLLTSLERVTAKLDVGKLRKPVEQSFESAIVSSQQEGISALLRADFGTSEPGVYTFTSDTGDVLVARWEAVLVADENAVTWMYDTPFETTFVFEVRSSTLVPSHLIDYSERLFNWTRRGFPIKALDLEFRDTTPGKERAEGSFNDAQNSLGTIRVGFAALSHGDKSYVGVWIAKAILSGYPMEADGVRERFPPLRSRLASVSRQHLFQEIGRGYRSPLTAMYPRNRDSIVIEEILSRGPVSDVEMYDLIVRGCDARTPECLQLVNARMWAFLKALERSKQVASYAPQLAELILSAKPDGSLSEETVGPVYGLMRRSRVDFSDVALRFVERGQFVRQSIYYLKTEADSEDALVRLEKVKVSPGLEAWKQSALQRIRERMAKSVAK